MGFRILCVFAVFAIGASTANAKPDPFATTNKVNEVRSLNHQYLKTGLTAPNQRTSNIQETFGQLIAETTILAGLDETVSVKENPFLKVPQGASLTAENGWLFVLVAKYPELAQVLFPSNGGGQ